MLGPGLQGGSGLHHFDSIGALLEDFYGLEPCFSTGTTKLGGSLVHENLARSIGKGWHGLSYFQQRFQGMGTVWRVGKSVMNG
jgi:hypothetical protein